MRGGTEAELLASLLMTPRWRGVRWVGSRLLDGCPTSVGEARTWVTVRLRTDVPDIPSDAVEVVRLLTSELTTNAITHSRSKAGVLMVRIGVSRDHQFPRLIHLEVVDQGSDGRPVVRTDTDGEGGRGLFLVESLAERWGTADGEPGRAVWCHVPYSSSPA